MPSGHDGADGTRSTCTARWRSSVRGAVDEILGGSGETLGDNPSYAGALGAFLGQEPPPIP
jgi:hypothetical protein